MRYSTEGKGRHTCFAFEALQALEECGDVVDQSCPAQLAAVPSAYNNAYGRRGLSGINNTAVFRGAGWNRRNLDGGEGLQGSESMNLVRGDLVGSSGDYEVIILERGLGLGHVWFVTTPPK